LIKINNKDKQILLTDLLSQEVIPTIDFE